MGIAPLDPAAEPSFVTCAPTPAEKALGSMPVSKSSLGRSHLLRADSPPVPPTVDTFVINLTVSGRVEKKWALPLSPRASWEEDKPLAFTPLWYERSRILISAETKPTSELAIIC